VQPDISESAPWNYILLAKSLAKESMNERWGSLVAETISASGASIAALQSLRFNVETIES